MKSRSIIEDKNLIKTINPSTEEVLNQYEIISKEEINDITRKAKNKFAEWKVDINKRIDFLHDFAYEFRKNKENLAKIATTEMGKVIKESKSEVEKCAWVIEYFADNGEIFIKDEVVNTDARKSIISFQPLGAIASIMPWNNPYWQALRFAAPSLIIGNTIVLKPASATMQCGIEIENTFKKIGLDGVFQTLVGNSTVAETLIDPNG
ncbi:MAG: aldehyde dehydrogenase family protein, partial [Nitrososphaeraceae archaeon]